MEEKLIVFISSRISDDMKEARQVVREAIEELPLTRPWSFEEAPAATDSLDESYLQWVRRCDLFILFLGEDITEPVRTEWETATQASRPRLVFLKKGVQDDTAWEFARGLDVKWKEYETLDKLKREVQVAVGDELIKSYRAYRMSRQEKKAVAAFIGRRPPIHTIAAIITALAAIAIAAYLFRPSPQPPTTTVIADSAALCSGPSIEYASIATLPQREKLTLLGKTPNGAWLKVRTEDGTEGWISRGAVGAEEQVIEELASVSGPPPPTPTSPPTATPTATVTATSTATSTPAPPSVSYEILLDCSRLMEEEFADSGYSKLEEAKRAIRKLIGTLVDPYFVAVRVFGHNELATVPCEDTDLLLPPDRAEAQRNRLSDAMAPLKPSGASALAAALREGLSELLESGSETLVLIIFVGGRDDCTGDVYGVIENNIIIPDRDIVLEIHLVSLDAGEVEEFEEATQLQVSDRIFRFEYRDVKSQAHTDDTIRHIIEVMPLPPSELTPSQTVPATPPTPVSSPTAGPIASPTKPATPIAVPSDTPTSTPIPTDTPTVTLTPTHTPIASPTFTPIDTPTSTPTPTQFYVYVDEGASVNHFVPSGWMGELLDLSLDEAWADNPYSGETAIRASFSPTGGPLDWVGLYWQEPENNWGDMPAAGFDLSEYNKLVFCARGEVGGERIEFGMGGLGRDADTCASINPYPDSVCKVSRWETLTTEWQEYTIDLSGRDLSYIIGGFLLMTSRTENPAGAVFYLDEIRFLRID